LKTFLEFCPITDYSGKNQFDVLLSIFKKYSIVRKLGAIIGDNSDINDILYRAIEAYLRREKKDF